MPLYEYQCLNCGKRTEVLQRFDDPPLAACPSCGGEVKKLISSPAFQFKGTGWYVTDYAGKKGGGPEPSKAKSEGKEGSGEGGGDKAEKAEKSEKTEKADKTEKAETKTSGGSGGSE